MAYPYTRSRARGEVADSDIEPSDSATSPHSIFGIFEGPSVEAVEGPESVSTGLAGPLLTLSQREALPLWADTAH